MPVKPSEAHPLSQDEKDEIQADIDRKVEAGEDPLLPDGAHRDRKKPGGQRGPRPPSKETAMKLSAEEVKLVEDFRARRAQFTPTRIKQLWEKRRMMEMTTSGNILPEDPPEGWLPQRG